MTTNLNLSLTSFANLPGSFVAEVANTEVGSSFVHTQCWTWDGGMAVGYPVGESCHWVIRANGALRIVEAKGLRQAASFLGLGELGPVN